LYPLAPQNSQLRRFKNQACGVKSSTLASGAFFFTDSMPLSMDALEE
jgi:hypothetical protein